MTWDNVMQWFVLTFLLLAMARTFFILTFDSVLEKLRIHRACKSLQDLEQMKLLQQIHKEHMKDQVQGIFSLGKTPMAN